MEKKQNLTKEQKEEVKSIFHDLLLSVEEQKKTTGGLVTGMATGMVASANLSAMICLSVDCNKGCNTTWCDGCTTCETCIIYMCKHQTSS